MRDISIGGSIQRGNVMLRAGIPLVLLIFLSAAASAVSGEILGITIQGIGAVSGFAKDNDQISTIVTARLSEGIQITPAKLERRYYWSSTRYTAEPFTSCSQQQGTNIFDCSMASPAALLPQGRLQFTIALFSDEQKTGLAAQRDAQVIIDTSPPAVRSFTLQGLSNNITNGQLTVRADIQDSPLLCSGIGSVAITADGREIATITQSDAACRKSIEAPINLAQHLSSGGHRICVLPGDRLQNRAAESSASCINLRLDTQAPACSSVSVSSSRNNIGYYGQLPHPVTLTLRSTDNLAGLAAANSRGIFAEMTGDQAAVAPNSCSFDGAAWLCTWNSMINTRESGFAITVQATDDVGNQQACSKSYTLQQDMTAPSVESVVVQNSRTKEQGWISKDENNTFIATLAETESGVKEIFADFSRTDLSPGIPIRTPTKSLGSVFIWENISCNSCTSSPKEVTVRGTDHTGNAFFRTISFPTDFTPPTITGARFKSGTGRDFITNSDVVVVEVRWADADGSGARIIRADFTALKEKNVNPLVSQPCPAGQNVCRIDSNAVGGPLTAAVPIWIIDAANNIEQTSLSIDVLQQSGVPSQYWRVKPGSIMVSPKQIDREITDLVETPLYLRFQLQENGDFAGCGNFRILDVKQGTACSTSPSAFASVLGQKRIIAPQTIAVSGTPGDRESTLITSLVPLLPGAVEDNMLSPRLSANITCSYQITTRCGTQSGSEDHELLIPVQYFNNPVGTLDASITQEIANVKDSFLVQNKWITRTRNYLDYFKRTCSLISAVTVVGQVISAIDGDWLDSLRGIPFINIIPVAIAGADAGTNKLTQGAPDRVHLCLLPGEQCGAGNTLILLHISQKLLLVQVRLW